MWRAVIAVMLIAREHATSTEGDRSPTRSQVIGAARASGCCEQPVGIRQKATMGSTVSQITLHEPATCVIRVRGALSSDWSDRLGGLRIIVIRTGRHTVTELVGRLTDQAALHGVLSTLYELGLPLLTVECMSVQSASDEPR
jgi:hypothetical protein